MKAERGRRGITPIFNLGDGDERTRPGRFTPGKETQYPLYKGVGEHPETGLDGCKKFLPGRDSIPGPSSS
jgi:hypothetical protein